MSLDDPRDSRQTDAGAGEVFVSMKPIEGAKQPVGVGHVESCSVITHVPGLLVRIEAEADFGVRSLRTEFDRIPKQVFKRHAGEARIRKDGKSGLNDDGNVATLAVLLQFCGHRLCQLADAEALPGDLSTRNARQAQQCIDQLAHALHAAAHTPNVISSYVIDGLCVVFLQGQAEAIDGAQRSTQIVRDGVTESLELTVNAFQLSRSQANAILQFLIKN